MAKCLNDAVWGRSGMWLDRARHCGVGKVCCVARHVKAVNLLGNFYDLIWESFPIQKWPLFSQLLIFPIFMIYFPKCE